MKKILAVTCICATLLIVIYWQFKNRTANVDPRGNLFAGTQACLKCHRDIYNSYLHTAHYLASDTATEKVVHGSFDAGSNIFVINKTQKVIMEKRPGGLFQTYYVNGKMTERHRFDIVFGGIKGETYLYWQGNDLYQLPLSYFSSEHKWSTSPGLGFNFIDYGRNRSIGFQCMDCHASFINYLPGSTQELSGREEFDKKSLVYHIDCERCHGPGAQHADFQTNNPEIKTARYIVKYSALNRIQKLDMCAQCHSGRPSVMIRSGFEFAPGDTFAKFKMPEFSRKIDTSHLDVHGNQLQLLESSKCFINSKLDCATCHDAHKNTRGNEALYVEKCLNCHNNPGSRYCKMTTKLNAAQLKTNCINCHMPALTTKAISVQVSDKSPPIQFFVHTHRIAIYPEEVKRIMAYIN
jgi:hypothetical protein